MVDGEQVYEREQSVVYIHLRDITSFMNATNVRFAECEGQGHRGDQWRLALVADEQLTLF